MTTEKHTELPISKVREAVELVMQPELDDVRSRVDQEGFDYAFRHYSNFEEIKDEKFHELRRAYVAAAQALADYLGTE